MNAWLLALGVLVAAEEASPRVVVLAEEPESASPGPVQTRSDQYRLRLGALVEGTLGRDPHGNMVGLPRARLRAEGLVSAVLEVGFVAELDISPWASRLLKEDGAGMVRDVYARMALGNKKLMDLGEARLGLFMLPVLDEQWRPLPEQLFLTGSLGREAWLPGRELAAAYEVSTYRYGIPVHAVLGMGSGVAQGGLLAGAGAVLGAVDDSQEDTTAAQRVPLTAGDPGKQDANPSLSLRVDGEPLLRWMGPGRVTVGAGGLLRPLSKGADARGALAADAEYWSPYLHVRAAVLVADTERPPFLDARSLMAESALQVIPDFADLRVRYDVAGGSLGIEAQRLSLGGAFFYLDGAAFTPLTESPDRVSRAGHVFTLLWLRTYDVTRFQEMAEKRVSVPMVDFVNARAGVRRAPLGMASWALGGDTDQLVLRIAM